jgi:hypothetical protein
MHCHKPFLPTSYPQPFIPCTELHRCPECQAAHEQALREIAEPVVVELEVVVGGDELHHEDGEPKTPEEIADSES